MKITTLACLIEDGGVFLGVKKKRTGQGKLNGPGGHVEEGETEEEAMIRECQEEVNVTPTHYKKVGSVSYYFPAKPEINQTVKIYLVTKWRGHPEETDEMGQLQKYPANQLPLDKMWDNDKLWLPSVLDGKFVGGSVVHSENKTLENHLVFSRTEIP
jgi:8-oxo-dGTP diphosphatase